MLTFRAFIENERETHQFIRGLKGVNTLLKYSVRSLLENIGLVIFFHKPDERARPTFLQYGPRASWITSISLLLLLFCRRWKSPTEDDQILPKLAVAKWFNKQVLRSLYCSWCLRCSTTFPTSNAGLKPIPCPKWCWRGTPLRRSGLGHFRSTAERLASLTSDVKATTTSCSTTYVSWITGPRRPDQKTLSRTVTDIT